MYKTDILKAKWDLPPLECLKLWKSLVFKKLYRVTKSSKKRYFDISIPESPFNALLVNQNNDWLDSSQNSCWTILTLAPQITSVSILLSTFETFLGSGYEVWKILRHRIYWEMCLDKFRLKLPQQIIRCYINTKEITIPLL